LAEKTDGLSGVLKHRGIRTDLLIALVLVFALSLIVANVVNTRLLEAQRQDVIENTNKDADAMTGALRRELTKIDVIANAVRSFVERQNNLSQQEYESIVSPLVATSPSIIAIAQSEGYILERMYPLEGNEAAIGLDYRDVPGQFSDYDEALRTGETSLLGPVELVQGGKAFIQRTPYYSGTEQNPTGAAAGIISIVLDREPLLTRLTQDHGIDAYRIAIREIGANSGPGKLVLGISDVFSDEPVTRTVPVDGGNWQIGLVPKGGWPQDSGVFGLVWVMSFIGCSLLGALLLSLWLVYRSKRIVEDQLRSAINSVDDGFVLYDHEDRLVFANEKYLSYYELSRDAIYPGNSFENILRQGLRNGQYEDAIGREEEWLRERLAEHRNPSDPIEQKLADGRWLKIAETRSPEGNTVGFRVDVTELKEAREKAEAANRAKTDFLNIVSHELRTPLTSVIGYARFLENVDVLPSFKALDNAIRDAATETERKKALDKMRSEVAEMSNRITVASDNLIGLINDILDRAKLEAESVELAIKPTDLKDIIQSVIDGLSFKAAEKGIELTTDVESLQIKADPNRLQQALINVVGNAIKFTDTGGVSITADYNDTDVRIIIRDTGCGIPNDKLEQVFEHFVQVDTSVTRRNSGTGLGLAISRELVELHGGTITASSNLGHGSTFIISLPLRARARMLAA